MFGLFQADLPIGNRLWLALLGLAVAGTLAITPLATATSNPIEFVTYLLSLYGQASFLEAIFLAILIVIYLPFDLFIISPRKSERHPFYLETERNIMWVNRIFEFASPILFVVGVVWSVNNKIDPAIAALGIFGLLFGELYRLDSFYRDAYEFLSIRQRINKQSLTAHLTSRRKKNSFRLKADWMETIVFLNDNHWEIIELTEHAEQGLLYSALLKRKYRRNILNEIFRRKSLLPTEILEAEILDDDTE